MAELANGGFESGTLSNWDVSGDVSIQQASFGSGPTQGTYQALLNSGPSEATMWQTFTASAGDTFSFDWNFLTNEGTPQWQGFNDKAWMTLNFSDEHSDRHVLADTWSTFVSSGTTFEKETGFNTFSVQIPVDGEFTIKFGVETTLDASNNSGLLIDNVTVSGIEDCMPALTNGCFETGSLRCWEVTGDVSIKQASFGSGPTQGTYQALLNSGTDEATMMQSFTASAGDTFSFDWNFLTNEGTPQWQGFNDKAWVTLNFSDEFSDPHILADTWSTFTNSGTTFQKETGFNTFSVQIPVDGEFTVKFGVQTTLDALYNSGLLIDNVKLQAGTP